MSKDPYRYFRVEARDLLDQLGRGVLALEKSPGDAQAVPRLLRLAHTLKGAARVVRQREIADGAHAIEGALGPWRDSAEPVSRATIDALLQRLDDIGARVLALEAERPAVPATSAGPGPADPGPADAGSGLPVSGAPASPVAWALARTDSEEMDALLEGVTQAHAQIGPLRRGATAAARARQIAAQLAERLEPRRRRGDRRSDAVPLALAQELHALLDGMERTLAGSVDQMDRELQEVHDSAEQLRLASASALFTSLERTARDAALALGKQVAFEARGGDVRLDADTLVALQDALVQLVRNAVAHGIETASQRLAAGKAIQGRVLLEVSRQGRRVVFSCSDDGAGLDLDAVRHTARRKGLSLPGGDAADAQALLQLLLRGGLSTAPTVTEVSGRGIGLDVVRDALERLRGDISVHTEAGRGTRLRLSVPLSIASMEALVVEAGGSVVALPLDGVRSTLRYGTEQIARTAQGDAIVHEGEAIPIVPLARVLQGAAAATARPARHGSAVIVHGPSGRAAIQVDRLQGVASVVLRPLPPLAPADDVVAGASFNAEGQPQIVCDADALVRYAQRAGAAAVPAPAPRAPVLVVDDSLTTRMLEQSILESAGYTVHAAVSAEDGLERARKHRYALFLVDVEMPGMDGFTFIERTRADPDLRQIPAILVTSRSSPEDRRRGQEVGAQGYIVKSEFAQAEFLRRVHELVDT